MTKRYTQQHVDALQARVDALGSIAAERSRLCNEWREFAMEVVEKHMPKEEQLSMLEGLLDCFVRNKVRGDKQ